jgi:hypothetical protein
MSYIQQATSSSSFEDIDREKIRLALSTDWKTCTEVGADCGVNRHRIPILMRRLVYSGIAEEQFIQVAGKTRLLTRYRRNLR